MNTRVLDAQRIAKEIRMRLRNPPNAVKDTGINLRRHREEPEAPLKPVKAAVGVYEVYLPLPKPVVVPKPFIVHYSMKAIFSYTAKIFGVPVGAVYGQSRRKIYTDARHAAVYLCRMLSKKSFTDIGRFIDRDHTTCINSFQVVSRRIEIEPKYAEKIEQIRNKMNELYNQLSLSAKHEPDMAVQLGVKESLSQSKIHQMDAGRGPDLEGAKAKAVSDDQERIFRELHSLPSR